jgi:uncharacterized NAD-dependent epimerase/dehydratase family protein
MKEYYSIIKIDESLDEQIEIPKKVLESEVYKVAIDILHEGEYWLHTHRKKTLDDSMELIEQYANQKVIEELDKLQNNYEMQLQKVTKEHPVEVEQDTYWRGVKIGLETCINVINELRQKE